MSQRERLSNDLYKAIRNFDFENFLQEQGVDVELRKSTGEIAGQCPFCPIDKRQSFYVDAEKGLWICHRCLRSGGPIRLIADVMDISYGAAVDKIINNFVIFVEDEGDDDWEEDEEYEEVEFSETVVELPKEFRSLDGATALSSEPYKRYAKSRGIRHRLWKRYNIGYCARGYYSGRLIIPVYHLGRVVSFVARDITGTAERKVDTPPGNPQYSYLFNLDNLLGSETIVVTEGVFDALVIPEYAVATFGKKITPAQAVLLAKAGTKNLVFCYDADAISDAEEFADSYSYYFDTDLIVLPDGEDPSSLGRNEMLNILHNKTDLALPLP